MKIHAATNFPFIVLGWMSLAGPCPAENISPYIVENSPVIALTRALIIDGTGGAPVANQTVEFISKLA
jgi:hypothetical protein